jgi:L-alanine-DL-glutamate epimerase-like enolase superfamily enzyme
VTGTADFLINDPDTLKSHVVRIEARHLALPTGIRPFQLPDGRTTPTDVPVVLVRLTDTDGVHGYSLLWAQQQQQARLVDASLRYLADVITQYSLSEAPRLTREIRSATTFFGAQGVTAFGVSGLLMAIEDLICRRRDESLSDLLGRKRDHIRAYQTGLMLQASIDELTAEATTMYDSGIRAMKMLVGRPTIEEDADRIQAVRQTMPDDASLMVDALQRWTPETALRASERFAEFGLVWIEDPLSHDDLSGYRRLAEESPVPIATGETTFSPREFRELLDAGIPYIIGEPERVGGLCAWADIAATVHDAGATMLPHLYPHVSSQLLATLPQDEVWLEYVPWFDPLVEEPLSLLADGVIEVGSSPGSGFTPCSDAVERLARGPWRRLND